MTEQKNTDNKSGKNQQTPEERQAQKLANLKNEALAAKKSSIVYPENHIRIIPLGKFTIVEHALDNEKNNQGDLTHKKPQCTVCGICPDYHQYQNVFHKIELKTPEGIILLDFSCSKKECLENAAEIGLAHYLERQQKIYEDVLNKINFICIKMDPDIPKIFIDEFINLTEEEFQAYVALQNQPKSP